MTDFESSVSREKQRKGEPSPTIPLATNTLITKTTGNNSPLLRTGEKFAQINSSDHLAQLFSAIQSHQKTVRVTPTGSSPNASAASIDAVTTSSISSEIPWGRSHKPISEDPDNIGSDDIKSPHANNIHSPFNEKATSSPLKEADFVNWITAAPTSTTTSNCLPHVPSNHSQEQKQPSAPITPPKALCSPPVLPSNEAFSNGSGLSLGASALAAAAMAMSPLFQQGAYGTMESASFLRAGGGIFPSRSVNRTWNPVLAAAAAAALATTRFHPPPPGSSSSKSVESDGDNVGDAGLLEERDGGGMNAEAALDDAISARLLNNTFGTTGGADLSVYDSLHTRPKSSGDNVSSKSVSPLPLSCAASSTEGVDGAESSGHHWTFQEQFKQLYELTSDPKRKEFLDELFSFMQKRGSPVNRIPIMAKQVLDLYELYRLVVTRGGLVEVINKKLWREITKGLQLPSSITSAAFTLRTQYMKYLYPYECEKLGLSTPSELQAAIDGNRREARRSSYSFEYPMLIAGRGGGAAASSGGNQPNAPSSSTCSSLLASSGGSPLSMSCMPSCAAQSVSTSGIPPPPPLGSSPTQLAGLHSHFLQPGYNVPPHLLPPGMLHSVAALSSVLPPPGLPNPLSTSGHRNPGMPPPPPPPPGLSGLFPTLQHGFEPTGNQSALLPSGFHSASGNGVVASSAAAAAAVAASMFGFAAAGSPLFSSPGPETGANFSLPHFTSASSVKSLLQTAEKEHGLQTLSEPLHDVPNSTKLTQREVTKGDKKDSPTKSAEQCLGPSGSGSTANGGSGDARLVKKFAPESDFTRPPSTSTDDVDYDAGMTGNVRSKPVKCPQGRTNDLQDGGNRHEHRTPNASTVPDNVDVNAKFLELLKHHHTDYKGFEFGQTVNSMGDRNDASFTAIQNAYRHIAKNMSGRRVTGDKSPEARSMEGRLMCDIEGFPKLPRDMAGTTRDLTQGGSDCTKSSIPDIHTKKQPENTSATCSGHSSDLTETAGMPRIENEKTDCNRNVDSNYNARQNARDSPYTTVQLSPEIRISTQSGKQLGLPGNTLVVCMEVNGIIYQGVLFGQMRSS
ncbi:AT-rich interactive domain-containing protein 3A [Sparganum proliferum]